jgi:hypothetical protein
MKRWLILLLVAALFFSFTVFACGDDDDDDDNDDGDDDDDDSADDDTADDDTTDDDSADDDTPDDSWAEGYDPCLPYKADEGWFTFADFQSKAQDFYEIFGYATTACTVSLNADTLVLNCPSDWSISALWLKGDGGFPLTDDMDVNVFASMTDGDTGASYIWVLNKAGDTLLFYGDAEAHGLPAPLPEAENEFTDGCAYLPDNNQPPMSDPWLEIFGLGWEATITGSHFAIDKPGESAVSDDDKLIAYLPVGYRGVIEETYESPKKAKSTTITKFLLQAMKYEAK